MTTARAGELAGRQPGDVGPPRLEAGRGKFQQAFVPVVHDPVLRPGQTRGEPAAHRAATAAQIVDGERAFGQVARQALGELLRARRRVGRLSQLEPLRRDHAHRATTAATSVSTAATSAVVSSHPRSDVRRSRAARRRRARSSASPSQRRSAAPRAAGSPGGTSSPAPPCPRASRHAADVGGEHRQAAGQGLGDDHAVGLRARGEHEQVGFGVCAVELRSGPRPREAHAVAQRVTPHLVGERGVSIQAAHARAAPRQIVATVASPSSSTSCPLPGVTAATHSNASPAGVPGREAGGVDAGFGHVRGQAVQLLQPAPAPFARHHDGGRRREHLALACVPERHVQEHDLPEPIRLRHERLWCRGRDQPVDQHHGAVRDPREGACEGGGLVHGVFVHRPAERGEPVADPAVVRVAAARPRRVVDALGHDDVDLGHSGRS